MSSRQVFALRPDQSQRQVLTIIRKHVHMPLVANETRCPRRPPIIRNRGRLRREKGDFRSRTLMTA